MVFGLIVVFFVQIVAVFGVSVFAGWVATPYSLDNGNQMTSKETGDTIQVAASDYCSNGGATVLRDSDGNCPSGAEGAAFSAQTATYGSYLSSNLDDEFFASMMLINLPTPTADTLSLKVNGFMRNNSDDSVQLFTSMGYIHISGTSFKAVDAPHTAAQVFAATGYDPTKYYFIEVSGAVSEEGSTTRRRMQEADPIPGCEEEGDGSPVSSGGFGGNPLAPDNGPFGSGRGGQFRSNPQQEQQRIEALHAQYPDYFDENGEPITPGVLPPRGPGGFEFGRCPPRQFVGASNRPPPPPPFNGQNRAAHGNGQGAPSGSNGGNNFGVGGQGSAWNRGGGLPRGKGAKGR